MNLVIFYHSLCIRKKISFANSKLLHKGVSFKKFGNDQLPEIDVSHMYAYYRRCDGYTKQHDDALYGSAAVELVCIYI